MTDFYRSITPELEIRAAADGGADGRTIEGLCVPYNHRQRIDDSLTEQFEPGAFDAVIELAHRAAAEGGRPAYRVHFAREHVSLGGSVIGKTIELRNDPAGLWGAWRVSKTPAGDETLELVRDGVLRELSIGFRAHPSWSRRLPDGTVSRQRADLFEVSVVLRGAYAEQAEVAAVRAEQELRNRDRLRHARMLAAGWPILSPTK